MWLSMKTQEEIAHPTVYVIRVPPNHVISKKFRQASFMCPYSFIRDVTQT